VSSDVCDIDTIILLIARYDARGLSTKMHAFKSDQTATLEKEKEDIRRRRMFKQKKRRKYAGFAHAKTMQPHHFHFLTPALSMHVLLPFSIESCSSSL
jgi:hypothetical protein